MKTFIFRKYWIFSFFVLISFNIQAQSLNISDGAYLNIGDNSSLVIPEKLNNGEGSSGNIIMNGNLLKVNVEMNLNNGSEFDFTQGNLNITTINYNSNSTFVFNGNNQEVMNHNFGNLVFSGTNFMQITGSLTTPTTCNNLTINNTGNVVKIPENTALTINGTLTNNAQDTSLVIISSNLGDGSLIFSTNNVNGTVQRYCSNKQWHYVSAPISNATTSNFSSGYLQSWDASAQWTGVDDTNPWSINLGTNMGIAQGYAYYSSDDIISFKGLMNVSNYSITLLKNSEGLIEEQGWNLIGNPYTSVIDWDVAVADGAVPSGAENAIYMFDDDNGTGSQSNYRYYVPSTGGTYGIGTANATKNIPLGQGFFIKTNTNNVTLQLKSSYRIHNSQEFYKSQQSGICRININGKYKSDEAILRTVNDASLDFDSDYDARKIFTTNDSFPQIYFLNKDFQNKMAINSIPKITDSLVIPIGLNAVEGDYSISISELSIYAKSIYLLDNRDNSKTNLNNKTIYNFHHQGNIVNNRFFLVFSNKATDLDNNFNNDVSISMYPNPTNGLFHISNIPNNSDVSVTDATGKILIHFNSTRDIETIDLSKYSSGVYLIKINNNRNIIIKKIIKN